MRNFQGLFDEIDSATASLANIDAALDRVVDAGIRQQLISVRKEVLRSRVRSIQELHEMICAEPLEIAA
ncbi:hypothetical protein [Chromatium okenii]|jgi:replicative DNA helicase|uniref:hypothetical protein n=1 Tax=Chromatium okenii TaxID=61644 RepID=UPI0026F02029|nr:hypothetical protein [Chromatium okenii]MBV5310794.1 hypothetical protein [Chromatium okenii]